MKNTKTLNGIIDQIPDDPERHPIKGSDLEFFKQLRSVQDRTGSRKLTARQASNIKKILRNLELLESD
jgi:hypothetical protein